MGQRKGKSLVEAIGQVDVYRSEEGNPSKLPYQVYREDSGISDRGRAHEGERIKRIREKIHASLIENVGKEMLI